MLDAAVCFALLLAAKSRAKHLARFYTMQKHVLIVGAILLLSASAALAQMRPGVMEAARACRPDIRQFCSDVAPGQGRIKACMKAHVGELSEPCKEALFQAWLRQ